VGQEPGEEKDFYTSPVTAKAGDAEPAVRNTTNNKHKTEAFDSILLFLLPCLKPSSHIPLSILCHKYRPAGGRNKSWELRAK
jgi:hypothetical protein